MRSNEPTNLLNESAYILNKERDQSSNIAHILVWPDSKGTGNNNNNNSKRFIDNLHDI